MTGIHRAYYLVVEHALVVVHVAGVVGIIAVQVLRQLRQVVGTAGLVEGGLSTQFATAPVRHVAAHRGHLRVRLAEHLAIADAAHGVAVAALNHRPEVLGQVIVIGIAVTTERAQGSRHHRDVLVGVARADGIDVLGQWVEECRTVEAVGGLQQPGLFLRRSRHLRQSGQRLSHAAHLAGNIHVPHLVAVAGTGPALVLPAVALDVGAVVQAVPHPQSHVLSREQGLVGHSAVVDVGGNVDESRQLLVHGIIRCPHPTVVVIGAIHLNQHTVLGGDGVQVAIAVLAGLLLVAVEVGPCALHLAELLLGGKVAGLPVAAQLLVPDERPLLALAQTVHHLGDVSAQNVLLRLVLTTGKGEGQRRYIVAGAVALQLRRRRVPAVRLGIALRRKSVGVAVVIELLPDGQAQQVVNVEVAVPRQPVLAVEAHAVERQRLGHNLGSQLCIHHLHLSRHGVAVGRGVVAEYISAYLIYTAHGIGVGVSLSPLCGLTGVLPPHLAVLALPVAVFHPKLVRQPRGVAHGHFHTDALSADDGKAFSMCIGNSGQDLHKA